MATQVTPRSSRKGLNSNPTSGTSLNGGTSANHHGNGECPVAREKGRTPRGTRIGFDPTIHQNAHSGLWGDFTYLRGDFSAVWGNVSGLMGVVTRLKGDLSYVVGATDGVNDTLTDFRGDITGKADERGKLPRGRTFRRVGELISL